MKFWNNLTFACIYNYFEVLTTLKGFLSPWYYFLIQYFKIKWNISQLFTNDKIQHMIICIYDFL